MDDATKSETDAAKEPLPLKVHIRWMIRRDMPEVLAIESARSVPKWDEETFVGHLRQRNCIGMVAEHGEKVVGYMIYTLHRTRLEILNLAVHGDYRLRRVGWQMLSKTILKLSVHRRESVRLHAREGDVDAQLWLRSCGFRATAVVRDHFDDADPVAYRFEYALPKDDHTPAEAQEVATDAEA